MFKGKKIAILGFGMEGRDLVHYLLKEEAIITVFDKKPGADLDFSGIDKSRITLSTGEGYLEKGLGGFDYIFRSPGVYRYISQIVDAEGKGVKISSAIALFFELCPAKIIGVTGTKGKGTTSSLIYEILKGAGRDVYLAGNIGVPYLELLPKLSKDSWVVLEISSFQLIDMQVSPHIAVVLNITQDHLDWHKDLDEYIASKKNIVKHQNSNDFAVVNVDYEVPESFSSLTKAEVFYFSREKKVKGSYCLEGKIYLSTQGETCLGEAKEVLLKGEHNLEN
ncbi:MAG: Mur ligase family protein, partial [Patescibacteria group bacterium]